MTLDLFFDYLGVRLNPRADASLPTARSGTAGEQRRWLAGDLFPKATPLTAESFWKAGGGFVMVPRGESQRPTLGIAVEARALAHDRVGEPERRQGRKSSPVWATY